LLDTERPSFPMVLMLPTTGGGYKDDERVSLPPEANRAGRSVGVDGMTAAAEARIANATTTVHVAVHVEYVLEVPRTCAHYGM